MAVYQINGKLMTQKEKLSSDRRDKALIDEATRIYNEDTKRYNDAIKAQSLAKQRDSDKSLISQYEAIPNYNILERTFNGNKKKQYEQKQSMEKDYIAAKNRETKHFIDENNITSDQLKELWAKSAIPGLAQTSEIADIPGADVDYLLRYIQNGADNYMLDALSDMTQANAGTAITTNALSSVANPISNIAYGVGQLGSWVTGDSKYSDKSDLGVQAIDEIRSTTKEMINGDGNHKGAELLYDVGMGVADFGSSLLLGGGSANATRAIQGAGAFGGGAYDAQKRGLSNGQAIEEGLVSGAAEYALSKIPLDSLFGTKADDALVKSLLKQGASEAIEEGGTSAINAIADSIIAGENSNFNLKKQAYIAQGMSEEEAGTAALYDVLKDIGYEGLVGGLSGTAIGGINVGAKKLSSKNTAESNELEPLEETTSNVVAETVAEPTAERTQMPLEPLSAQQTTNAMPNNESALNSQIQADSKTVSEVATPINYDTKSINGFDDVSKEMNKLIGMYGNDSIKAMHSQVNSLINEYMATNDTSKFHEAMEIASEIDKQLLGKTYKYKANRKGIKGENARREVAYTPDSYIDTLYSEVSGYQDVARENATDNVVPDLANVGTVNQYADVSNIESDNQRVRSYNTTLIEKTDAPQELKNEFIENPQIYTQLSNKATLESAMDILNNNDLNTAIVEYRKMLDAKNPIAIPLGYNISKQLVAEGRLDESVQVIRDMSKALTESGQFSQSAAITLMNNDPETAKRYLIREIDNLNKKGKEKFGKKWTDFGLTENELKKFDSIKPGDVDAIKQAYQDVYNRIQKEYPSTFKEKLMEYRRVAMLLNVRTNIRNVVSNAMLSPVRWTADRISALGEGVYSLINPNYQRTQSANPFTSKKTKKLAKEVFEANKDVLLGENKYDDAGEALRDKQVFKGTKVSKALDTAFNGAITKANQAMGKEINPSLMETARNFTYYLLEKGDNVFVKANFVSRLSSYLDAQGITDIADVPADAITLATQEAMKATFKDDTKLSQTLSNLRKNLGVVGDIVMPFTKTPANLAMRGIDYSPVGVINGIKTLRNATTNEDVARGITQLGQAATGTAGILLGYLLAESGWIVGGLSDDKDEAQFQKQQGKLAYSIKTPWGDYITYDWAQPASIPLILGSTIYDSLNEDVSLTSGLKQGGLAVADSWLELSPLQNLSDIFGGYGTPAENVLDVLATDFPLSFIPSQLGAIARSGDNTQRTTYSNDYLENLKNQAMSKIPGLSQQLPTTYDTWGREVQRYDNLTEGLIANMLNPGQLGNESVAPLDDEILELYESTGNAAVFPKKAGWTENKQKLSAEEYSEFQRISGSNSYDMVEALIYSPSYSLLDDEQKVEIISDIYNFSNALADKEVTNYDIESSKTYGKAYAVYEEEGAEGVANFYAIKKLKVGDKQAEIVLAIEQMDLSDNEKGYYLSLFVEPNKETVKLFNSKNWDDFYDYYFEKTAKDRTASNYNELDPLFSY